MSMPSSSVLVATMTALPPVAKASSACRRSLSRRDDPTRALARAGKPLEQRFRVADGRRKPDPLKVPSGEPADAFEDRQEMPSTVVPGERVELVDDDSSEVPEEERAVDPPRGEHHLDRLGGGEEHVRRVRENLLSDGIRCFATTGARSATDRAFASCWRSW